MVVDTDFRKLAVISGSFDQFDEWLVADLTFGSLPANRSSRLQVQITSNQSTSVEFTLDSGATWRNLRDGDIEGRDVIVVFVDEDSELNFRHVDEETIDIEGFVSGT